MMIITNLPSLVCMQREEGSMQKEDGSMLETDRSFARNRHEEMGKRLNDPTRKNAHDVLKIEGKLPITQTILKIVWFSVSLP